MKEKVNSVLIGLLLSFTIVFVLCFLTILNKNYYRHELDNKNSFENQLQSLVSNNNDFLEKMRLILDKNISDLNNAINSIKLDNAKTINDLRDLLDKKTSETMGEMKRFNKRIAITSLVFTIVGFLCGVIALVIALMK